jgi:hypothetical protein
MGRGDRVTHTLPRLVAEFSTEDTLALAAEAVHAANENHRVMFHATISASDTALTLLLRVACSYC